MLFSTFFFTTTMMTTTPPIGCSMIYNAKKMFFPLRQRHFIIIKYLDALAQQRLCINVRDEIDSFLKGLNGIIPDNLLSIFDENELEVGSCVTR